MSEGIIVGIPFTSEEPLKELIKGIELGLVERYGVEPNSVYVMLHKSYTEESLTSDDPAEVGYIVCWGNDGWVYDLELMSSTEIAKLQIKENFYTVFPHSPEAERT